MSLCAIIPIKPLRRGKSRLSSVLSEEKRRKLNEFLFTSTIECINKTPEVKQILVISYDPSALKLARNLGARTILENRNTNINRALRKATIAARAFNSTKVLIIPADLPLITKDDVAKIISYSEKPPEIVIAPDRKMCGTNALLVNPIGAIKYNFGESSFNKHIEQAERKRINIRICQCENLSFDLDEPEDLELIKSRVSDQTTLIKQISQEVA